MNALTKEEQCSMSPVDALNLLKDGNSRFINNNQISRNLLQQAHETCVGQYPLAVVLSCIDSRTSVELIFDQGIGDVFSARVAGNIINEDILGSMEFACKVAGSKVVVVLGHSECGAVKGACDSVEMGNLTALLNKIRPSVQGEKTESERSSKNNQFVEKVTNLNIQNTVQEIMEKSPILKEMIEKKEIGIIGALHDIKTGSVNFYKETSYGL